MTRDDPNYRRGWIEGFEAALRQQRINAGRPVADDLQDAMELLKDIAAGLVEVPMGIDLS